MGGAIVEGLNKALDNIRAERNLDIKGYFFVFQQISEPIKFGNLTKYTWKVHYTGFPPSTPISVSVTAKVGRDDFKRDLVIALQQEICRLVQSEKWEDIINGESI